MNQYYRCLPGLQLIKRFLFKRFSKYLIKIMSTLIDSFWANSSVNRNRSFQMLAVTVTEWQIGKKERKVARCAENYLQA